MYIVHFQCRSRSPRARRPPPNRSGPSLGPGGPPGVPATGVSRRAPPTVGRGISASTKSGGPTNRSAPSKNAATPVQKPVARVPEVARVPSVPSAGKEAPKSGGKGPPNKASPMKQPAAAEKKSQRPELARPRLV